MPQSSPKSRSSQNHTETAARPVGSSHKKDRGKSDSTERDPTSGKLEYEASLATAEAIAYFESVIEGLKKGAVHFKHGGQTLTLTPSDAVAVEIGASRKGSKQKVSFELRWDAATTGKLEID